MKVSAVIPAFNAEGVIARAIESVLHQTRSVNEIIVVDDGSTDQTVGEVGKYSTAVKLIRQQNKGASSARNAGICGASCEWIAFLDADDEWMPEKNELQYELLKQNPDLVWAYGNYQTVNGSHSIAAIGHVSKCQSAHQSGVFDDYLIAQSRGFHACTPTLVFQPERTRSVGFFTEGMKRAQDTDLWFRIAYTFPMVGYSAEPLAIVHRETPGSSTKVNNDIAHIIDLLVRHIEYSKKEDRFEEFKLCVRHIADIWTEKLIRQRSYRELHAFVQQFEDFISEPLRQKAKNRLVFPYLGRPRDSLSEIIIQARNLKHHIFGP